MEGTLSLGMKKGAWTAEEDGLLRNCIETYGEGKWHLVPIRAGLNRCRKSCRLRWLNYLKPSINREAFGADEVDLIIRLHKLLGNRWSLIAGRLPGRTANDVKNYWNTHLSKKHEPCKVKTVNKKVKFPATPPAKKIDVIRPQPRSFSSSRYLPIQGHLGIKFPGNVTNNNNNNNNNEDDDDYNVCGTNANNDNTKFMEDDMTYKFNPPEGRSGEKAWWESLLEESEESDERMAEAVVPVVAPSTTAVEEAQGSWMGSNLSLSTFDVDLWNLLNAENGGLN